MQNLGILWCISVRPSQLQGCFIVFNVCTVWLHTLSYYIVERNQLGLHIILRWRSYALYALSFCRKLKLISRTSAPKSIPYIVTLPKLTLSYYIGEECTLSYYFADVYAALSLCCAIPNNTTLLSYSTSIPWWAIPIITHCWGKSNRLTLLSKSHF